MHVDTCQKITLFIIAKVKKTHVGAEKTNNITLHILKEVKKGKIAKQSRIAHCALPIAIYEDYILLMNFQQHYCITMHSSDIDLQSISDKY